MNEKIQLHHSAMEMMMIMSEGNPGAATVLLRMISDGANIDPDSALGGLGAIFDMDRMGIRGSKIWMLYKDVCRENFPRMMAVLRGNQLGFVADAQILHAIENRGDGIDVLEICRWVVEFLPNFKCDVGEQTQP